MDVLAGAHSDDDPPGDVDSLGANSIPSIAASVLSAESVAAPPLVSQPQASQRAANNTRRRPSSLSSSSARSTSRVILNQSGDDNDEDFEQDAFQSPPAVDQSKKRTKPCNAIPERFLSRLFKFR